MEINVFLFISWFSCDCMLYGILWDSISFVHMVLILCIRYYGFQMEELRMIEVYTQHVSTFCELLWFNDVLLNIGY